MGVRSEHEGVRRLEGLADGTPHAGPKRRPVRYLPMLEEVR